MTGNSSKVDRYEGREQMTSTIPGHGLADPRRAGPVATRWIP